MINGTIDTIFFFSNSANSICSTIFYEIFLNSNKKSKIKQKSQNSQKKKNKQIGVGKKYRNTEISNIPCREQNKNKSIMYWYRIGKFQHKTGIEVRHTAVMQKDTDTVVYVETTVHRYRSKYRIFGITNTAVIPVYTEVLPIFYIFLLKIFLYLTKFKINI